MNGHENLNADSERASPGLFFDENVRINHHVQGATSIAIESDSGEEISVNFSMEDDSFSDSSLSSLNSSEDDYLSSEDSSIDDYEEWGIIEMLHQQLELFTSSAPSFLGVSLQIFYNRIIESLDFDEEKDTPTPQYIRDQLPTLKITLAHVAANLLCCVCCVDYTLNEDVVQLPCSHLYHKTCVNDWLKLKSTCPTCRLNLTEHVPTSTNQNRNRYASMATEDAVETMDTSESHTNGDERIMANSSFANSTVNERNDAIRTSNEQVESFYMDDVRTKTCSTPMETEIW